jgi:GNAT superfamily N-acetyltransferase
MDTITITPLQLDEIDTLIPLARRIWHAHYPSIISIEQIDYMLERGYTRPVIEDEMNNGGVIWLSIKSGEVMIGFAAFGPYAPGVMKLHKLYLLPEYHGSGIGARALTEVERIARESGTKRLVLNVNKHNNKAITAYQRAGWRVAEVVVVDIGNGFVMDDYVMAKEIPNP